MPIDVSRLNEAERHLLLLLAAGHTAKTIAAATDVSANAVNERLRAARRKTGASSSRELARALREQSAGAQENRDELFGMAGAGEGGPAPRIPVPFRSGIPMKGWIMASLALAAAAFTGLLLTTGGPPAPDPVPHVVATSPASGARIVAGRIALSVTFDRPMRANSYSFVMLDPLTYPDCAGQPRQSRDGRTFTLDCTLAANRTYEIAFNSNRFRNFVSADGRIPAEPAVLRFSTQ